MKGGGSGSWLLHRFLRKNDVNTIAKIKMDITLATQIQICFNVCPIKYKYKQVFEEDIDKGRVILGVFHPMQWRLKKNAQPSLHLGCY